ncbi:MAG TPA: 3-oxoacyl-[acyl-carrier-protein] reductase [Candidatus Cloacimonadota bacterium]|nr:3-oxoacyl-[acyl-carrier-protein] reductase [Candidatus Cloacimonadota bacterium]HPT71135.1 3-oxoacyl-[acyl-carrier-protein] reductase [Candidatus Cloacimonadota bacterium]
MKDKIVVITGSARGIGYSIAEVFGREGGIIIILDLFQEGVDNAVAQLKQKGFKADGFAVNVTDSNAVETVVGEIIGKYERIDVLINNAGITKDNLLLRMKEEEWDAVLAVNLKGAFICTQKISRHMLKQKSGSIINMASVIGIMGNAGQTNYAASKGGLIAFTKSCAKEFASRQIRVNAVAPGFIQTEMTTHLPADVVAKYAEAIPLNKMGTPDDVANACLFLASQEAEYITGQTIQVDGGLIM